MTNQKNLLLLPIVILGIATLLIVGGYLYFDLTDKNPTKQSKNNTNQNNESSYIENITIDIEYDVKILSEKLVPNTKPMFEVGEKFEYETTTQIHGILSIFKSIYSVDKIERINNTDYYIIVNTQTNEMMNPQTGAIVNMTTETKSYINKETGEILKIVTGMGGQNIIISGDAASVSGNGMFATWMLSLTDDFKWKVKTEDKSFGMRPRVETLEYRVIGREKVNNRDCFKVEMRVKDEQTGRYEEGRIIFLVDVKKRIVTRMQMYSGALKIGEMNLVSEL